MGALAESGGRPGLAENSTYRFIRAATSILWGQSAAAGALRLFLFNRIFPHLGRSMAWWKRTPTLRQLESSFEPTPGTRTRTKATTMLRKNHFLRPEAEGRAPEPPSRLPSASNFSVLVMGRKQTDPQIILYTTSSAHRNMRVTIFCFQSVSSPQIRWRLLEAWFCC